MASTNIGSVQRAAELIRAYVNETPVLSSSSLSRKCGQGRQVFLKCECFQKTGSFKFRGVLNAILSHERDGGEIQSVVTHSSGNHGKALAYAAAARGIEAHIVMPEDAPQCKKNAVAECGGKVILVPNNYRARKNAAKKIQDKQAALLIHSSHDFRVMSGQGTIALEFLSQVKALGHRLDAIICPVGGGGLCAGVAIAAKALHPNIRIFGAEPEGAADAFMSKNSGILQEHIRPPQTIADGLKTTILGNETWPAIKDLVDEIITVSDKEIIAAMQAIYKNLGIVVEPSGAISLAVAHSAKFKDYSNFENIGVIVSGGNIELSHFHELIGSVSHALNEESLMEESQDGTESAFTDMENSSLAESEESSGDEFELRAWC